MLDGERHRVSESNNIVVPMPPACMEVGTRRKKKFRVETYDKRARKSNRKRAEMERRNLDHWTTEVGFDRTWLLGFIGSFVALCLEVMIHGKHRGLTIFAVLCPSGL